MARPPSTKRHALTVHMELELLTALRERARRELGPMPARNGDRAAVLLVRRLVETYLATPEPEARES